MEIPAPKAGVVKSPKVKSVTPLKEGDELLELTLQVMPRRRRKVNDTHKAATESAPAPASGKDEKTPAAKSASSTVQDIHVPTLARMAKPGH
jgi:pyruvate dehydrogenase E2 component (dihydrolipoamide acetyltransferase)